MVNGEWLIIPYEIAPGDAAIKVIVCFVPMLRRSSA